MIDLNIIIPIVVALFGGGGIIAFLKLRGENALTAVSVAQGAVVVQSGVIDSLRDQIAALSKRVAAAAEDSVDAKKYAVAAEARAVAAEVRAVAAEARAVAAEREKDQLSSDNIDLRLRVTHLEKQVRRLNGTDETDGTDDV